MTVRRTLVLALAGLSSVSIVVGGSPGLAGAQTSTTADPTTTSTAAPTTVAPPTVAPTTTAPPVAAPPAGPFAGWSQQQLDAFVRYVQITRYLEALARANAAGPPVPAGSGSGRRMVYSVSGQRVWLVGDSGNVEHTYLVSGRARTPAPGLYRIFSKSPVASSGSVRMNWMMRFAKGRGMAIGFHSIPYRGNGSLIQSFGELGQYRSHGCVRQRPDQAKLAWDWAPLGTLVAVTP